MAEIVNMIHVESKPSDSTVLKRRNMIKKRMALADSMRKLLKSWARASGQ